MINGDVRILDHAASYSEMMIERSVAEDVEGDATV
jgi:hypothetical protein